MRNFIVYNQAKEILRTGGCQNKDILLQAVDGEFVMKGIANDLTQKIEFDGLDDEGQPINPRIVDKTSAEVEQDSPKTKPKPFKKCRASITNEQYQALLKRIDALEGAVSTR